MSNTNTANNNNEVSGDKSEVPSATPNKKTSKTGEDIYLSLGSNVFQLEEPNCHNV